MARFRNRTTGVIVGVDDTKIDRFGTDWEPLDASATSTSSWSKCKVAELRAEITRRNEDRPVDEQLPVDGVKADLVATLEVDDQA